MTYQAEIMHYYARIGRCPRCSGKNKLLGDEKMCPECRAKAWIYKISYYERNPQAKVKKAEGQKNLYEYRANNGLCTKCGETLEDDSYRTCDKCRLKQRLATQRCRERKYANG